MTHDHVSGFTYGWSRFGKIAPARRAEAETGPSLTPILTVPSLLPHSMHTHSDWSGLQHLVRPGAGTTATVASST